MCTKVTGKLRWFDENETNVSEWIPKEVLARENVHLEFKEVKRFCVVYHPSIYSTLIAKVNVPCNDAIQPSRLIYLQNHRLFKVITLGRFIYTQNTSILI